MSAETKQAQGDLQGTLKLLQETYTLMRVRQTTWINGSALDIAQAVGGLIATAVQQAEAEAMPVPAGPQAELAEWQAEHDSGLVLGVSRDHLREHLAAMPQAQPDAELLKALKRLDEEIEDISGNADACVFCGDASGDSHSKECPITQARAAIAQHETGAAG